MKIKYVLAVAAVIGAAIPGAFLGASRLGYHFFGSTFDLILWPSSMLLMGEAEGPEALSKYTFLVSLLANIVYYIAVASLGWAVITFGRRALNRGGRSEPNKS